MRSRAHPWWGPRRAPIAPAPPLIPELEIRMISSDAVGGDAYLCAESSFEELWKKRLCEALEIPRKMLEGNVNHNSASISLRTFARATRRRR